MSFLRNASHLHTLTPIKSRGIEQAGRFVSTGGGHDLRVVEVLNDIFEFAVREKVSDIHLELDDIDGLRVRLRIDGELVVHPVTLDPEITRMAKTKLCAKAKLDDQERLMPQDGRMMVYFDSRRIDIRVAVTPTVAGFKIVCRLLDSQSSNVNIDTLEMPFIVRETLKHVTSSPEGIMLMSGPTGSGKTTSLYALLQYLNIDSRNIITIENPVEYAVQGYTQIEVDGHMTFAKAMRSSLRQDPDVIMVGEIRDDVSAEIALSAGTSGHMVFSTVHANSAAEIPTRLLYFGLMGHEIASVLLALVAQRLVRRIRDGVVPQWVLPNDIEREWLTKRGMFSESMRFPKIEPGDFEGRLPMVEMIEVTPAIRAIMEGHSASGASDRSDGKNWIAQIVELAVKQPQFETLAQAGVGLALAGKTTLQEVIKATGDGGYTPSRRRYEQILVHEGLLSIEDLEQSHREINEARQNGKIILLKDHLVAKNRCSKEDMAEALRRRYAPTISTPTPGIPVINPIPSGIGIQSQ